MPDPVERFEILVRHGALCSRLEIGELTEAYRAMEPSLHRYCNTPDVVDVEALLYATDRLPTTIYQVREVLIQADAPDKLPQMAGIVRLAQGARRRPTFQVGNDTIIVVAREGRTELLDLITLLCCYQIEAQKISSVLGESSLLEEIERVLADYDSDLEERNRLLARLAFELGTTDDLLVELDIEWGGELLERLHYLCRNTPNFLARLHRDYSVEASRTKSRNWAQELKRLVDGLLQGGGPLHIISSNTHSTLNLLSGYALKRQDEIWEWALQNSEHKDRLPKDGTRPHNLTYFLLRDWLRVNPKLVQEKLQWEMSVGVVEVDDSHYTGIRSQVFALAQVDPQFADPRLRDGLLQASDDQSVIVNFDYAFGEQAGILVEHLFKEFQHRVASFSIMGKAGTVVGGRGGIMLPNFLLKAGSRDLYDLPGGNALGPQDLSDLGLGKIHHNGPMLTVAGTILQNSEMLKKYREEWNILGLEMEGIPYIRALHQCVKRGWVCPNLKVLVGYYASDAPLEVGETLARELALEGVNPTYGLNLGILRKILKQHSESEPTLDELRAAPGLGRPECILDHKRQTAQ